MNAIGQHVLATPGERDRQGGEREAPKPTQGPSLRQGGANEYREEIGGTTLPASPREPLAPLRPPSWNSAGLLIVVAVGLFCWLGRYIPDGSGRGGDPATVTIVRRSSITEHNNNANARSNRVVDLEGTAVVYPAEVKGLVAPDGYFRTDLSLGRLAEILKIDSRSIARSDSATEVNHDAVLFTVVTGRLSENAKARSRAERRLQASEGLPSDFAADEWVTSEVRFSLNALDHPSDMQKSILGAIWRSAQEFMPEPGEKIRAVPVSRLEIQSADVEFSPGYLPLESPAASEMTKP